MAIAKIILNGVTQMDVTGNTVATNNLLLDEIATGADGEQVIGAYVPSGGGEPAPEKDVNFIDYDGTIIYSYTKNEALALDSLPSNPSHAGLTAQGWNYTLAQIKTECNSVGKCTVGQMYVTQSGDTEIDVVFVDSARLSPILTIAVNGTVTVDWGDNTTADTVTGTSLTTRQAPTHTYANTGEYTIKIHVVSGAFTFYGSTSYYLLRKNGTGNENKVYSTCVSAIRIGTGITSIGNYSFYNCQNLTTVTIPSTVTSIGTYAFEYCYNLVSITIPSTVTSIGTYAFYNCYNLTTATIPSSVASIDSYGFYYCCGLESIDIPSTVTSIGTYAFYNCYNLSAITIPSGVTSIGNSAFTGCFSLKTVTIQSGVTSIGNSSINGCTSLSSITIPSTVTNIGNSAFGSDYGVAEYHFLRTTPPTLGTTAFQYIVSDCIIYVPRSENQTVLNAYKTETNWSAYASYMQEEPA